MLRALALIGGLLLPSAVHAQEAPAAASDLPVDASSVDPTHTPRWRIGVGVGALSDVHTRAFLVGGSGLVIAQGSEPRASVQGSARLEFDLTPGLFVGLVGSVDLDPSGSSVLSDFDTTIDLLPTVGIRRSFPIGRIALAPRLTLGGGPSLLVADRSERDGLPPDFVMRSRAAQLGFAAIVTAGLEVRLAPRIGLLVETGLTFRRHVSSVDPAFEAEPGLSSGQAYNAYRQLVLGADDPELRDTSIRWTNRISLVVHR